MGKTAAKQLEELMRKKGIKQKDLAEELEVSPAYVSGVLAGSKPITASTATRFSRAMDLKPDEVVSVHRAAAADMGFTLDLPDDF